jgi:hypothetical protein
VRLHRFDVDVKMLMRCNVQVTAIMNDASIADLKAAPIPPILNFPSGMARSAAAEFG